MQAPRLTYDPDMDMIIYEHLISESGEPNKEYTYIPDGDYEGQKWMDGKWVHIEKVFTKKTVEGEEPVPLPIRDAEGTLDDSKLSHRLPEDQGNANENADDPATTTTNNKATPPLPVERSSKKVPLSVRL